MPIDKIFEKIDSEAEAAAARILAEAAEEASRIKEDYAAEAARLQESLEERATRKAGEEERHIVVGEQLRLRKAVLARKREILDSVYEEARKRMLEMPLEESRAIIRKMILSAAVSGEEEVILPGEGGEVVTPGLLEGLSREFGRGGGFRIAKEKGDFAWGVILRQGRRVVDLSLEVVFRQIREKTEPRIAALLFDSADSEG